jgi:hypothetical protein
MTRRSANRITPKEAKAVAEHEIDGDTGERGREQSEHLGQGHPPGTLYGCQGCEAGDCQHEPGDGDDWCVSDRHLPREAERDELRREGQVGPISGAGRGQGYAVGGQGRDADREAGS